MANPAATNNAETTRGTALRRYRRCTGTPTSETIKTGYTNTDKGRQKYVQLIRLKEQYCPIDPQMSAKRRRLSIWTTEIRYERAWRDIPKCLMSMPRPTLRLHR